MMIFPNPHDVLGAIADNSVPGFPGSKPGDDDPLKASKAIGGVVERTIQVARELAEVKLLDDHRSSSLSRLLVSAPPRST